MFRIDVHCPRTTKILDPNAILFRCPSPESSVIQNSIPRGSVLGDIDDFECGGLRIQMGYDTNCRVAHDGKYVLLWTGNASLLNNILSSMKIGSNWMEELGSSLYPFRVVVIDKSTGKIWFGKDVLGLSSMIVIGHSNGLTIASDITSSGSINGDIVAEVPPLHVGLLSAEILEESIIVSSESVPTNWNNISTPRVDAADDESCKSDCVGLLQENLLRSIKKTCSTEEKCAVMFSGGIDCSVVVLCLDTVLSKEIEIDLVNVSFACDNFDASPDRITSFATFEELSRLVSPRKVRLVLVNVTKEMLESCTPDIYHRMFPAQTVMDFNLSSVVYFATKGEGTDHESGDRFHVSARTFLNGLGADEVFCGYRSHRRVFSKSGWEGLRDAVVKEMSRLWYRNLGRVQQFTLYASNELTRCLGRDWRMSVCHDRNVIFPFLDFDFLLRLNREVPLQCRCALGEPNGSGDKKLLRELGRRMGLVKASQHRKRAMQFGSRIAAVSFRSNEGTDKLKLENGVLIVLDS